jgi:triphosphoribosyl-dephospho-CoA synthase
VARVALESLHVELLLAPKPGLVSPGDNGSHPDMTAATLMRSLFALRHYFTAVASAGWRGAPFSELQHLGIEAEARMLRATDGVNTHRGAIFNLGLLAAAHTRSVAANQPLSAGGLGDAVRIAWRTAICAAQPARPSHGLLVATRHGAGGARLEATLGYPSIVELALPALRDCLRRGCDQRRTLLQTLFVLIAHLEDTNLLYRGGTSGLRFARNAAGDFLAAGGVFAGDWEARAAAVRDAFVARNLSPGGAADLLAATWFVHRVTPAP